jgi:hypothetical protein
MTRIPTFDEHDVALLSRLGLSSPNLELWVDTSLGQVTLRHNVQVSVSAISTPSIFFTFHFYFPDMNKRHKAETGSGDFRAFWKTAKRFAKEKRNRQDPLFEITEVIT